MEDILDRIRAEHTMTVRLLGRIERLVKDFAAGKNPDLLLLKDMIDFLSAYSASCHHPVENILYAALAKKDSQAARTIEDLQGEHDAMDAQLRAMAQTVSSILMEVEISRQTFAAMTSNFLARQLHHLSNEETDILRLAGQTLDAREREDVQRQAETLLEARPQCREMIRQAPFLDWPARAP